MAEPTPAPRSTSPALAAFLVLVLLLLAPTLALVRLVPANLLPWTGGWLALVSIAAFAFYAWDKRRARRGEWRTPEKILHLLALLGGWPGAFLAQRLLRHKNAKVSFQIVFWLIVSAFQYIAIDALLDWRLSRAVAATIRAWFSSGA